jgi:integrase
MVAGLKERHRSRDAPEASEEGDSILNPEEVNGLVRAARGERFEAL